MAKGDYMKAIERQCDEAIARKEANPWPVFASMAGDALMELLEACLFIRRQYHAPRIIPRGVAIIKEK